MRMLLLLAGLLAIVALTAPTAAQPGGDPVPKILEAWKKRQTAFKTVRYVVTGKVEHLFVSQSAPPGLEKMMKVPKAPFEVSYRATVLLHCNTNRFRVVVEQGMWSAQKAEFIPSNRTRAFDGQQLYSTFVSDNELLGKNGPDVGISKGTLSQHQIEAELWPVFTAHGIVPTAQRPLVPHKPPVEFRAEMFQHRGQLAQDGSKCEVLQTEPLDAVPAGTDELWVDLAASGFIRRQTYFAGRNPFAKLDVTPMPQDGATIPKEWTCTWYEGKRTKVVHRLKVDSFEGNLAVTDDDFRISLKTGMKVEERTVPEPGSGLDPNRPGIKKYTVSPSGSTALEETPQRQLDGTEVQPTGSRWWLWVVGGVSIVMIGVGIYLKLRHARIDAM